MKLPDKGRYNMVRMWYCSPYALSDHYYSYAIYFLLFWARIVRKDFRRMHGLEIIVLTTLPSYAADTVGRTI